MACLMSQSSEVSLETQPMIQVPDLGAVALASSSERRSCLETQQDKLPGLPIPAKAAPRAHHRSGTPHFKVIHRAGLCGWGLRP